MPEMTPDSKDTSGTAPASKDTSAAVPDSKDTSAPAQADKDAAESAQELQKLQEEADTKTSREKERIRRYLTLRYDFRACTADQWLDGLYDKQKAVFREIKGPSGHQVRKQAGISLFDSLSSLFSSRKRQELEAKKKPVRDQLQAETDAANAAERERCDTFNAQLSEKLKEKMRLLTARSAAETAEYFTHVLQSDSFILDKDAYQADFRLLYDPDRKQLAVDYALPSAEQVPQTAGWAVGGNGDVVPVEMDRAGYLAMYERILFDIALRVTGLLIQSDSCGLLDSVVFNGSRARHSPQEQPAVLLSFVMPKAQYAAEYVRHADCVSKREIARLGEARYIDDLHSESAPGALLETPPAGPVSPIRSAAG